MNEHDDGDDVVHIVGDADIKLLGFAAAMVARYQARRKGGVARDFSGLPRG